MGTESRTSTGLQDRRDAGPVGDTLYRVWVPAKDAIVRIRASQLFDDLYVEAILCPEALDKKVDSVVSQVKEQGRGCAEGGTA